MPIHPSTVTLDNFKGINNVLPPNSTPEDFLKEALNIDIDKSGGVTKRSGYTQRISGDFHSVWSENNICFAVKDNDLVRIYPGFDYVTLLSGVGDEKVSFDTDGVNYYFSSPRINGVVDINNNTTRSWGLERPNPITVLSYSSGLLKEGTYQIVTTYIDSFGRESGASPAQVIDIPDNSKIILSGMYSPLDSNIVGRNIYCSPQNGSELYLIKTIPSSTSSTEINDVQGVRPIRSTAVYPAPRGHIIKYAHSRMWIAEGDTLWYSDALTYDWFRLRENFFQFEDRIRAVMPTQDGMWVAADRLYYLAGKNPESMTRTEKEPVKVVEGSEVKIVGAYLFIDNTPIGYKWLVTTDQGVFACFNDGVVINLTSRNVNYPLADKGTGMFVRKGGTNRYTTILQKRASTSSVGASDQVTADIIRNGVKVEE